MKSKNILILRSALLIKNLSTIINKQLNYLGEREMQASRKRIS